MDVYEGFVEYSMGGNRVNKISCGFYFTMEDAEKAALNMYTEVEDSVDYGVKTITVK